MPSSGNGSYEHVLDVQNYQGNFVYKKSTNNDDGSLIESENDIVLRQDSLA